MDSPYRYGYGGKEFTPGIGLSDFGARWYDAGLGRWLSVDPLATSLSNWSPYNYTYNNPVNFTDPTGMYPYPSAEDYELGRARLVSGQLTFNDKPEDVIVVNSDGQVSSVIRDDSYNVFIDESTGDVLNLHDPLGADRKLLTMNFDIGDEVYIPVTSTEAQNLLDDAGTEPKELLDNYVPLDGHKKAADLSISSADFPMALWDKYGLDTSSKTNERGDNFLEVVGPQFRFGSQLRLYNPSDAGQFLWGGWMHMNTFTLRRSLQGANVNELKSGGDSRADQPAIRNGYAAFPFKF